MRGAFGVILIPLALVAAIFASMLGAAFGQSSDAGWTVILAMWSLGCPVFLFGLFHAAGSWHLSRKTPLTDLALTALPVGRSRTTVRAENQSVQDMTPLWSPLHPLFAALTTGAILLSLRHAEDHG